MIDHSLRPRIVHLVDDTTAGGVMRVLDHIQTSPEMSRIAQHIVIGIERGELSFSRRPADIIVSHLAISWRSLPMLIALRVMHPRTALVHVEHSYTQGFVAANVTHKRRFAMLLRLAYGLFNRVVAVSPAQGHWLIKSNAVSPSALSVIPSCVDLSGFRGVAVAKGRVQVIGAIGRLDRQKGFDTLITAFRATENPDIALHIYGEGPEKSALVALAGDDKRIRFNGFARNPVTAMASVDAVAMPSNWEAYGLVAIETLAAGRQLLVNNVDGLVDHVGQGARLVPGKTVKDWQLALQDLTRPRKTTAARGCYHFEQVFAANWHHLVQDVLQHDPSGRAFP